ncbi:cytochrome P450 86B1-like [Ananas comosus]|uniref:Cytochrome P450 86B1-like n=1 Tax=Ananas comosus TaxID=4615 RepID=A0A6P5GII2_ANACO|nr:cytochrome P450 86B1-like [Ananas comosus]
MAVTLFEAIWAQVRHNLTLTDVAFAMLLLFFTRVAIQRLTTKGPMLWPILGIIPTFFVHRDNAYDWVADSTARCGGTFPYRGMWLGRSNGIVTADPAIVEHILKTRFANFPKGRYYQERFADFLGEGIFNADGRLWREQRRAATAEMHSARFTSYSAGTVTDLLRRKLLPLLDELSAAAAAADLQNILLRFTFDNICTAAFGVDPGCLGTRELPDVPFARAFEEATELSLFRFIVPPFIWKPMRLLNVGTERRLKTAIQTVHAFAEKTVSDRRTELQKLGSLDERSDLLSRLMNADSTSVSFSDKLLKDFCISLILAGRDTSSVALVWFFWLLHRHPHVETRIVDEITRIVKKRYCCDSDDIVFTVDEVKKMEYLHAALSESLRLYPSVPIDFKEAAEDDMLPGGTAVRKGWRVIYSMYSMGRAEAVWGRDCREFRPERWMSASAEEGGLFVGESPFKYAVFNAGPRLCVGKRFAYVQMKMVAAAVLRRYRVVVAEGQVVAPKLTTTLYMRNGLTVTFKRREIY